MALGKPNRPQGKAVNLELRQKSKEGAFLIPPVFQITEKQADGTYPVVGTETDVSGDAISLTVRTREVPGQDLPSRSFNIGLRDNKVKGPDGVTEVSETYFVNIGLNSNLGRSLANSILNLKSRKKVQIGTYSRKGTDGKTYGAASIREDGSDDTVKWRYDDKTTPALPAPRIYEGKGGVKERDFTAQEEFLYAKLEELSKTFKQSQSAQGEVPVTQPVKAPAPASAPQENLDESVPF